MNNRVRGLTGETSVPAGDISLASAYHVAGAHTLDDISVSMAAWKILWVRLSSEVDKTKITYEPL